MRQTPIENEDDDEPRCVKCSEHFRKSSKLDVRLCTKCGGDDLLLIPRKFTPKSSFDEYISRSQRGSAADIPIKDQLASLVATQKFKVKRSNTIEDSKIRRKSDSFYKRKSSGTAQEKILKHKTNLSKSPTNSVRSFGEKRLSNVNLSNQFKSSNEYLKISNLKMNDLKSSYGGSPTGSRNRLNSSHEFLKTSRDSAGDTYLLVNTDDEESVSDNSRMSQNRSCLLQSSRNSYDSRQSSINNDDFLRQTGSNSRLSSRQSSRQSDDRLRADVSRQSSLREELKGRLSPTLEQRSNLQSSNATCELYKSGKSSPIENLPLAPYDANLEQILESHSNETTRIVDSADAVSYSVEESKELTQKPESSQNDDMAANVGVTSRQFSNPNIDFNNVSIEMIDKDDDLPDSSFKE